MAVGVMIGAAVIGGIGAYKSKKAAKAAAEEQARLDRMNSKMYQMEVAESVKRTKQSNEAGEGAAKVNIGASGFASGSSMDSYLETVQATNRNDVEWMEQSGASNVAIQEREASARQRNANKMADARFIGEIGQAIGSTSSAWG